MERIRSTVEQQLQKIQIELYDESRFTGKKLVNTYIFEAKEYDSD